MTKEQFKYALDKFEEIRKIARHGFALWAASYFIPSKQDSNSWSIYPKLLGYYRHIDNIDDAREYFYMAREYFIDAFRGEAYEGQLRALEF